MFQHSLPSILPLPLTEFLSTIEPSTTLVDSARPAQQSNDVFWVGVGVCVGVGVWRIGVGVGVSSSLV